jgi:hypothetical protein
MRLSTGLRVASIIIAAKTILIGLAYWRRAEIIGCPIQFGTSSWIGLVTVIAIGLAIAAGVYVAARHYSRKPNAAPLRPPP